MVGLMMVIINSHGNQKVALFQGTAKDFIFSPFSDHITFFGSFEICIVIWILGFLQLRFKWTLIFYCFLVIIVLVIMNFFAEVWIFWSLGYSFTKIRTYPSIFLLLGNLFIVFGICWVFLLLITGYPSQLARTLANLEFGVNNRTNLQWLQSLERLAFVGFDLAILGVKPLIYSLLALNQTPWGLSLSCGLFLLIFKVIESFPRFIWLHFLRSGYYFTDSGNGFKLFSAYLVVNWFMGYAYFCP